MCFGAVVEGHDAPAETDEEVGTKRNEGPKGQLFFSEGLRISVSIRDGQAGERERKDAVPQGRFRFV